MVGMGETDGRTDGVQRIMRQGHIITQLMIVASGLASFHTFCCEEFVRFMLALVSFPRMLRLTRTDTSIDSLYSSRPTGVGSRFIKSDSKLNEATMNDARYLRSTYWASNINDHLGLGTILKIRMAAYDTIRYDRRVYRGLEC